MELNRVCVESARISAPVKFLFLSDLHDRNAPEALELIPQEKPDFIAFTGDASAVKTAVLTAREVGLELITAMGEYPGGPSTPYLN